MNNNLNYYITQDGEEINFEAYGIFKDQLKINDFKNNKHNKIICNFVGFLIKDDSILISFPKNFLSLENLKKLTKNQEKIKKYAILLFATIRKSSKKKDLFFYGIYEDFNSGYPFQAFFEVYLYFLKYGLFSVDKETKRKGYSGKIIWKDTIQKSPVLFSKNSIIFVPMIIKTKEKYSVFLSSCMAYVIDSTIEKFSFLLKETKTGYRKNDFDFSKSELVISKLRQIKQDTFKDKDIKLINDLITFFENIHDGGKIAIKMHTYNLVWELMVENFLNRRFSHIQDSALMFIDKKNTSIFSFEKLNYKVNEAALITNGKVFNIYPDHYFLCDQEQYIFDSKYYLKISELDYKQISYFTLLHKKDIKTYNALIAPTSGMSYSNIHLSFKENNDNTFKGNFEIIEQYLSIKEVMKEYIKY
ncbi:hypothetical protein DOK67_0002089 [Enterococcus sp. DIV0212c]|uniref:hypothetical protein n=1 Tax=Enterococcus sp. DIV0212c TaxID=2230867 RepID=UPI001A9B42AE|nr:hypothetical protein [Enterococcus sp. DIV0212c]MBO1354733.1 hypothetical protein [Enterococcus sp. DIV0212c]